MGEKLGSYSSENMLLRRRWRETPGSREALGHSIQCAICFRPQRSFFVPNDHRGNNFEIRGWTKNTAFQNFGCLLTTRPKGDRRCWTTGIIGCGGKNPVNGTAASLQLPYA
jgi:hypothetical protein